MDISDEDRMKSLVGKYVDISEVEIPGRELEGIAGWVKSVTGPKKLREQTGYSVMMDYGMGWFVTAETIVKEVDPPKDDPGMFDMDANV